MNGIAANMTDDTLPEEASLTPPSLQKPGVQKVGGGFKRLVCIFQVTRIVDCREKESTGSTKIAE